MSHYDPMHELDEVDEPTVAALADRYNVDLDDADVNDPDVSAVQLALAQGLAEIGPQTMDDTAKWNGVQSILRGMVILDNLAGVTTEFESEIVEEEAEADWADGGTYTYETTNITARSVPNAD